jgi:hypothetical protein
LARAGRRIGGFGSMWVSIGWHLIEPPDFVHEFCGKIRRDATNMECMGKGVHGRRIVGGYRRNQLVKGVCPTRIAEARQHDGAVDRGGVYQRRAYPGLRKGGSAFEMHNRPKSVEEKSAWCDRAEKGVVGYSFLIVKVISVTALICALALLEAGVILKIWQTEFSHRSQEQCCPSAFCRPYDLTNSISSGRVLRRS